MPTIAITLGDPAGIGPEVVEQALTSGQLPDHANYLVLGERADGTPGKPDTRSAISALNALERSVELLRDGTADAVVTGPVSKQSLQAAGFNFPGQTEFFADAFGVSNYGMLLTGPQLSVGLATIHEPLANVPSLLTTSGIVRIGLLTAAFLKQSHAHQPRIAVAGLNPHAGENGRFGDEEARVIQPAIDQLNATGMGLFSGPHPPDAVFRAAAQGKYDGVIAMYHDQGLIPLKLLDFEQAVNVTLGLPHPRTSPDHGTAFDIAGKNQADPSSMIAAIRLAVELTSA